MIVFLVVIKAMAMMSYQIKIGSGYVMVMMMIMVVMTRMVSRLHTLQYGDDGGDVDHDAFSL